MLICYSLEKGKREQRGKRAFRIGTPELRLGVEFLERIIPADLALVKIDSVKEDDILSSLLPAFYFIGTAYVGAASEKGTLGCIRTQFQGCRSVVLATQAGILEHMKEQQ